MSRRATPRGVSPRSAFLAVRAQEESETRDGDALPYPHERLLKARVITPETISVGLGVHVPRTDITTGATLFRTIHPPIASDRRLVRGNGLRMVKVRIAS